MPSVLCCAEERLERNSIAAFLLLIKNLIRHHPVNQESLLHCHGPSVIGAMLSKVRALHVALLQRGGSYYQNWFAYLEVNFFTSPQLLCNCCTMSHAFVQTEVAHSWWEYHMRVCGNLCSALVLHTTSDWGQRISKEPNHYTIAKTHELWKCVRIVSW